MVRRVSRSPLTMIVVTGLAFHASSRSAMRSRGPTSEISSATESAGSRVVPATWLSKRVGRRARRGTRCELATLGASFGLRETELVQLLVGFTSVTRLEDDGRSELAAVDDREDGVFATVYDVTVFHTAAEMVAWRFRQ